MSRPLVCTHLDMDITLSWRAWLCAVFTRRLTVNVHLHATSRTVDVIEADVNAPLQPGCVTTVLQ